MAPSQAHTFPGPGHGYDKHDFSIVFDDGEVYEGRLDCKSADSKDNDLDVREHIINHLTYVGNHPDLFGSASAQAKEFLKKYIQPSRFTGQDEIIEKIEGDIKRILPPDCTLILMGPESGP